MIEFCADVSYGHDYGRGYDHDSCHDSCHDYDHDCGHDCDYGESEMTDASLCHVCCFGTLTNQQMKFVIYLLETFLSLG